MRGLIGRAAVAVAAVTGAAVLAAGMLTVAAGADAAATVAAVEAPLPANAGSNTTVEMRSVSCASAGNCAAVGNYFDSSGNYEGLLLTQTAGTWTAAEAPLPANAGSTPRSGLSVGVVRLGGQLHRRRQVLRHLGEQPGAAADPDRRHLDGGQRLPARRRRRIGPGRQPVLGVVRVGGRLHRRRPLLRLLGQRPGLLLTQTAGTWTATEATLPANAASNAGGSLPVLGVVRVGGQLHRRRRLHRRLGQRPGAVADPDRGRLDGGRGAAARRRRARTRSSTWESSVSCASAGNCTAVGQYTDSLGQRPGLLLDQTAGTWTAAQAPLPANAQSNPRYADLKSVSCASAGNCTAVGIYASTSESPAKDCC